MNRLLFFLILCPLFSFAQQEEIEKEYFDKYWMSCAKENAQNYTLAYASDDLWIIEKYTIKGQILSKKKYLLEDKITRTGIWKSWHPNGQLSNKTVYDNKDKSLAYIEAYNERGQIIIKGTEKESKKDGEWTYYYANGKTSAIYKVEMDSLVSTELWNRDGSIYEGDVESINPSYPGGETALVNDIYGKITYPELARQNNIEGLVVISLEVEPDGSITNVRIKRSVHPSLDKEALRVVLDMKKWNPGKLYFEDAPTGFNLPVRFQLTD